MNDQGLSEKEIFSYLENVKSEDTDYYRVLSSMCTHPHKIAVEAHRLFIEANLGDLGLFAGASRLETEVIRMLGNLLHVLGHTHFYADYYSVYQLGLSGDVRQSHRCLYSGK